MISLFRTPLLGLALCCASAPAATLTIGDSLIPTGLGVGDSFQLAFVTAGNTARGTGGDATTATIGWWNSYVNAQADASTHGTHATYIASLSWSAIASTSAVSARDNALVSAPVYNMNKVQVAVSYADMWDGTHSAAINYTQNGTTASANGTNEARGVWTGTQSTGLTWAGGAYDALDDTGVDAIKGDYNATGSGWVSNATWRGTQSELAKVYALSEVITVVAVPEPRAALIGGLGMLALLRRRR